jgi:hypothetical protein
LGSRGAKRYVECLTRPPTVSDMALKIIKWVGREFPSMPASDVAEALDDASIVMAQDEAADASGVGQHEHDHQQAGAPGSRFSGGPGRALGRKLIAAFS